MLIIFLITVTMHCHCVLTDHFIIKAKIVTYISTAVSTPKKKCIPPFTFDRYKEQKGSIYRCCTKGAASPFSTGSLSFSVIAISLLTSGLNFFLGSVLSSN